MNVFLVLVGGIVGAVLRVVLDSALTHRWRPSWPVGTLLINVLGSGFLGVLTGLSLAHGLSSQVRLLAGTGFCGAFTTFSAVSYEVVRLAEGRRPGAAGAYALGTAAAALGAAVTGLALSGGLS